MLSWRLSQTGLFAGEAGGVAGGCGTPRGPGWCRKLLFVVGCLCLSRAASVAPLASPPRVGSAMPGSSALLGLSEGDQRRASASRARSPHAQAATRKSGEIFRTATEIASVLADFEDTEYHFLRLLLSESFVSSNKVYYQFLRLNTRLVLQQKGLPSPSHPLSLLSPHSPTRSLPHPLALLGPPSTTSDIQLANAGVRGERRQEAPRAREVGRQRSLPATSHERERLRLCE